MIFTRTISTSDFSCSAISLTSHPAFLGIKKKPSFFAYLIYHNRLNTSTFFLQICSDEQNHVSRLLAPLGNSSKFEFLHYAFIISHFFEIYTPSFIIYSNLLSAFLLTVRSENFPINIENKIRRNNFILYGIFLITIILHLTESPLGSRINICNSSFWQ